MKPFAYELMRLRTLRSTWILSGVAVLFSALIGLLVRPILDNDPSQESWATLFVIAVPTVTALCCALIGVFAFGHEYRYGTIRPTLTALPRRIPVALAKIVVAACFSFLLSLACLLVTFLVGAALGGSRVDGSLLGTLVLKSMIGAALYAVGFSLLGAGLTALFRNQVIGVVVVIVMPLIVESALSALLLFVDLFEPIRGVANYLPFSSGSAMYRVGSENREQAQAAVLEPLSRLGGGAVYFAWALAICALGIWRFNRSDA
jgi:ABC-2 type transport system permease protein